MEYIILDDLFGVKLWGENIFRRVYHHLSNNNYDPRKVPLLHEIKPLLTDEQVAYLQGLTFQKDTALNTTKLSLLVGGQYSPRSSIYYNDMDKDMQTKMEDMGNSFIPQFETILGTKLRLGIVIFAHVSYGMKVKMHNLPCIMIRNIRIVFAP